MTVPSSAPSAPVSSQAVDLANLLGDDQPQGWQRNRLLWIALVLLLAVAAGLWWWLGAGAARNAPVYVTTAVERGNVTLTVTANGTLNPTRTVDVGSELSGTVSRVLVDVNDRVTKGQVLVELDRAKFEDTVHSAQASLKAAQATLAQSEATAREARATLTRYEEVSRLSGGRVPSATELDSARAAHARAVAEVDNSREQVSKAQATLSTEETNLAKASISSPIDGVVLARDVDPGNAVAASLQAVTLFTLGEDLTRLTMEASVDEADVGSVRDGQTASFTVSAYPSRRYPATVERVSYGSTITNNVVTYTTDLAVDNSDLSLRPGMTATATIVAVEHKDVLLVPNTALRFTPSSPQTSSTTTESSSGGLVAKMMPRPPRSTQRRPSDADNQTSADSSERQIWVLQDRQPVAITVQTGISNGLQTEVSGPELQEGMAVITDQRAAQGGK